MAERDIIRWKFFRTRNTSYFKALTFLLQLKIYKERKKPLRIR